MHAPSSSVDVRADLNLSYFVSRKTPILFFIGWTDEILQNQWGNSAIDSILIGQSNVWLPDVALHNGFESLSGLGNKFLLVKVEKTGAVTWKPYQVFESACTADVTFFPFDKTSCNLNFVVWSNTKDLVNVTKGTIGTNVSFFDTSAEWSVLATTAADYITGTSSGVTFSIELKRKPLFYLLNILMPVIMLAVINVFVFVLPASSGEKTGLAVTIFLAFAVFLTIISAELPQTSEKISTFAAYLFLMTLTSTFIVIITISQLRLFSRDPEQPIPDWLQGITRCVRRMSCRRCCRRRDGYSSFDADEIKEKLAADVTWENVCDALDFTFFWFFFVLVLVITVACVVISVLAAF